MSNTLEYILKFTSNADKQIASINKVDDSINKATKSAKKFGNAFVKGIDNINKKLSTIQLDSMLNNIERVADGINNINTPGLNLTTELADLSAIADVTGSKLKQIEGLARNNAKTFGGSAAQGVTSYKLILSKLNPEIAKAPKALAAMGNAVSTASRLMGNDAVAATEVLTTAMNQYEISTEDPIKASEEMATMMNIMAAAAQQGSAELPEIKSALENSGLAAKKANVHFAESNAAIQIFDKAGKKGAEGGVALRNVLATLSQGRFLPKDVQAELTNAGIRVSDLTDKNKTLAERLKPLRAIMNDGALMTKLFGKENQSAALAIVSGIGEMERLTGVIQNTNTAYEQAAIVMEAPAEKNARLKARIDDMKISLFNATNGLMGYASVIADTTRDISNLIPLFGGFSKVIGFVTSAQKMQTLWTGIVTVATKGWAAAQAVLNIALSPIFLIPAVIISIGAAIAWVVTKTEGWGKAWQYTVIGAKLLFKGFIESIKTYFSTHVNGFMMGINKIKEGWLKFKNFVGIGDKSKNQEALNKIRQDTEARKKAIAESFQKTKNYSKRGLEFLKLAGGSIKLKVTPEASGSGISNTNSATGNSPLGALLDGDGSNSASGAGNRANNAIATGGTKHNYVTITMESLANVVVKGDDFKQNAEQVKDELQEQLLRLLASATTAAN